METDLVLEGGGVKGIGLVGAITVLEERGWRFHRVAGTSAGAIVGALVAAGMPASEISQHMWELDYRKFRDHTVTRQALHYLGRVDLARTLLFDQGMYSGEYAHSWLDQMLATRGIRTFGDLRDTDPESALPEERRYRLVVMASDISQGALRRLPWDYHHYGIQADTVPVADAVRASMSIPFFYRPVKLDDSEGRESWLVDGGMLSNFPIDVFDRPEDEEPRWPTIGIKLSSRPDGLQIVANQVHGTVSMAKAMLATMVSFHDHLHLDDPPVQERTIFVDTTGVSVTDFDIDRATQQRLYDNGRAAAEKFLRRWGSERPNDRITE